MQCVFSWLGSSTGRLGSFPQRLQASSLFKSLFFATVKGLIDRLLRDHFDFSVHLLQPSRFVPAFAARPVLCLLMFPGQPSLSPWECSGEPLGGFHYCNFLFPRKIFSSVPWRGSDIANVYFCGKFNGLALINFIDFGNEGWSTCLFRLCCVAHFSYND